RQCLTGARLSRLTRAGSPHRGTDIRRQIGRGSNDQLKDALEECGQHRKSILDHERARCGGSGALTEHVMEFRTERDPLGELNVPADAYYGIQTARAVENFPISGLRAHPDLITATILVKKAAAEANAALGRLDADVARAIVSAADEILTGRFRDQFVVDV